MVITKILIEKFKQYLIEEEKSSATLEKYMRDVTMFFSWLPGRDVDKISLTGLKPVFDPDTGAPYFEQARLVLICKKLYSQDLEENCFYDKSLVDKNYPNKDFHRMYYGEIVSAFINK